VSDVNISILSSSCSSVVSVVDVFVAVTLVWRFIVSVVTALVASISIL